MNPRHRRFIQSVQGQLALLGITFVGAIGLAVATWIARPWLFEPYIRETYPAVNNSTKQLAEAIISGQANEKNVQAFANEWAEQMAAQELEKRMGPNVGDGVPVTEEMLQKTRTKARIQAVSTLYGYWMSHADNDPRDLLLLCLLRASATETLGCLKRTLAVGSLPQRTRALHGTALAAQSSPDEAIPLLRYARDRAARRGETELAAQAEAALEHCGKTKAARD